VICENICTDLCKRLSISWWFEIIFTFSSAELFPMHVCILFNMYVSTSMYVQKLRYLSDPAGRPCSF
jgi:hypothetical protein